jgi:hypothetical protein
MRVISSPLSAVDSFYGSSVARRVGVVLPTVSALFAEYLRRSRNLTGRSRSSVYRDLDIAVAYAMILSGKRPAPLSFEIPGETPPLVV